MVTRRWGRDRLLVKDTYVVSVDSGDTFRGLLVDRDDVHLQLVQVAHLSADGTETAVDGTLFIPVGNVLYLQRP